MGSQRIENITEVTEDSLSVIRNNRDILVYFAQFPPMVFPKLSYSI